MEAVKRSCYWDNIKGVLIFLVVFSHVLWQMQEISEWINICVDFIYMFHMPAFVFVSGFFGKSEKSKSFDSIMKLVFLYIIFNSLTGAFLGFESLLIPVYSYWYLLALIAWRKSTHYLSRFKYILPLSVVVALLIGFFPDINNTFALSRIIAFYPFYLLGFRLSKEKSNSLIGAKYSKRFFVGIGLSVVLLSFAYAVCLFFNVSDDALLMNAYSNKSEVLLRAFLFVIAFLGILALRMLSVDKTILWLSKLGRNSLWIYILHRPVTLIVSAVLERYVNDVALLIAGSLLLSIGICLALGSDFVNRRLNRFLESGVDLLSRRCTKKVTMGKCALFLVLLCLIPLIFIDPTVGIVKFAFSCLSGNTVV